MCLWCVWKDLKQHNNVIIADQYNPGSRRSYYLENLLFDPKVVHINIILFSGVFTTPNYCPGTLLVWQPVRQIGFNSHEWTSCFGSDLNNKLWKFLSRNSCNTHVRNGSVSDICDEFPRNCGLSVFRNKDSIFTEIKITARNEKFFWYPVCGQLGLEWSGLTGGPCQLKLAVFTRKSRSPPNLSNSIWARTASSISGYHFDSLPYHWQFSLIN